MTFQYNLAFIGSVVFIDLMFSGDNVLAISAAALPVPKHQRRLALSLGAIGATGLRICLTLAVSFLFAIPLFQLLGGLLVLFIAIQLLKDQRHEELPFLQAISTSQITEERYHLARRKLLLGVATIVLVDSATSLDNIVALGAMGAATKTTGLVLAIGLIFSKVLLYLGGVLVVELLRRVPWLVLVASFLLAIVAGELLNSATGQMLRIAFIHSDQWLHPVQWLVYGLCGLVVVTFARWQYCRDKLKISN